MELKDYTQVHRMERHSVILVRTDSFFTSSKIRMLDKPIVGVYWDTECPLRSTVQWALLQGTLCERVKTWDDRRSMFSPLVLHFQELRTCTQTQGRRYCVTEQPLQNSTIAHATVDLSQIPWQRTVHKCTRIHLHIPHIRTQVRTFRKWLRLSCDSPCLHVTVVCMSQLSACHSCVHVTVVRMSQLCACHSCLHVTVV